jgi:CRP-like cAMP-binding protein
MPSMPEPGSDLLAALPRADLDDLADDLELVRLEPGRSLLSAHQPIRRVYFPESGLIALTMTLPDGRTAGVSLVGREGVIGAGAAVGAPSLTDAFVQVPGAALAIPAERFRAAFRRSAPLRTAIETYGFALEAHLAQTVACNRLHSLDQRAARWLLLARDRLGAETFPLTQEAFADLLGVSRPAVSTVGARFGRDGAAEFRRGTVHIGDLARLERASCECMEADRAAFRPVAPWAPAPNRLFSRSTDSRRSIGIIRPVVRRAR